MYEQPGVERNKIRANQTLHGKPQITTLGSSTSRKGAAGWLNVGFVTDPKLLSFPFPPAILILGSYYSLNHVVKAGPAAACSVFSDYGRTHVQLGSSGF